MIKNIINTILERWFYRQPDEFHKCLSEKYIESWMERQPDEFRVWLLNKYCKKNSVVMIVNVNGKLRSNRYVLSADNECDGKAIKQLGVIAARTVHRMQVYDRIE